MGEAAEEGGADVKCDYCDKSLFYLPSLRCKNCGAKIEADRDLLNEITSKARIHEDRWVTLYPSERVVWDLGWVPDGLRVLYQWRKQDAKKAVEDLNRHYLQTVELYSKPSWILPRDP